MEGTRLSKVPSRKKKRAFGHQTAAAAQLLDQVKQNIINSVATQVLLMVAAVMFPQFAAAIYAGYFVYKYGVKALELKRDYDNMEGEPEEKVTILAAREGFKAGVSALAGEAVGRQVNEAVSNSVQTTTRSLSNSGTFTAVSSAMNIPGRQDDLRYFFSTTMERTVEGVLEGTENAITDYVARRVIK